MENSEIDLFSLKNLSFVLVLSSFTHSINPRDRVAGGALIFGEWIF
jgi:hypothetical protein